MAIKENEQTTSIIRLGYEIDESCLEEHLSTIIPTFQRLLQMSQFNLTPGKGEKSGNQHVLHKKPSGPLISKSVHEVEREYCVLNFLDSTDVPIPRAVLDISCSNIGKVVNLEYYGKSVDFYPRQLKVLSVIYGKQTRIVNQEIRKSVGSPYKLNELMTWFQKNLPQDGTSIINEDYKFDNLAMGQYGLKNDDSFSALVNMEYLIQLYCSMTSAHFSKDEWVLVIAFSFFKTAVILQGVFQNQVSSTSASAYPDMYLLFMKIGLSIINENAKSKL
ncbi:hypothetical protein K501DRAFT_272201 [Backusella circina FSU 941]|nr:hypothetical protein K501DRAFT_272201 [Backusella circina FSU 941]